VWGVRLVRPEEVRLGTRVRVGKIHRIAERRGKVGTVVGRYGGEDYVAADVRFSDGGERLFWPRDLEEVAPPRPPSWSLRGRLRGAS
jgi:hypothetical protein